MIDKASATTYVSCTLTAMWGFVTSQEFGIFAGVLIGAAGLVINAYYKHREDKRKSELHEITLRSMAGSMHHED